MTIPVGLEARVAALATAVTAAAPLASASRILVSVLQQQGAAALSDIETALAASAGNLDAGDPTGFPGDLVNDLLALSSASDDQTTLADMRGLVGRAMFNLAQAGV